MKRIKLHNADGTPIKVGNWEKTISDHINSSTKEFLGLSCSRYSDELQAWKDSLPTYHRGKLKGPLQFSKDQETLIVDVEVYNETLKQKSNGLHFDESIAFECFSLVGAPWVEIRVKDKLPNVMGLYHIIEKDYCDSRHAVRSFEAMGEIAKEYEAFKEFRGLETWEISFTETGYEGEQLSFSIKIAGEWHHVTRFQPHERTYWKLLFTKKTKRIILSSTNIMTLIAKNEKRVELSDNKHNKLLEDTFKVQ